MSSTLKNVIVSAILKVSSDPAYAGREYASPDAAREDFTKALIELLFPENPSVPAVKERKKPGPKPKLDENGNPIRKPRSPKSVVSPDSLASSPAKEKKKPGPKPKLDENGEPIKKVKSPKKTEEPTAEKAEASPRKARAPMSEEAKAAMVAKRKATMEAKKAAAGEAPAEASPKKTPKKETPALPASPPKAPKKAKKAAEPEAKSPKKAKKAAEPEASPKKSPKKTEEPKPSPKKAKKPSEPATTANLDKFTPTQKKKLTEIVGDKADKKDVLSYLNGLSNAAFHDKKLEDHFRDYAATLAPPAPEPAAEEQELVEVEFDGETYAVNSETKRVYTVDESGNATPVGYVGMAKFADMELPDDDSESEGEE